MRTNRIGRAAILAALPLLAPAASANAAEATETLRRGFTLARIGGGRAVEIENVNGSIRVRGTDGDRVEVTITQTLRADDAAALARGREEVELAVVESPGRLELAQDGPFRDDRDDAGGHRHRRRGDPGYEVSWDWEVALPRDAALEVSTVNGGEVRVEGVSGRLAAANVNGDVELEGVGGSTGASTVNGRVRVAFAEPLAGPAEFSTVNGEIDLSFPPGFGAELRFSTLHGEVYTDFEVDPRAGAARVESERGRRGRSFRIGNETVVTLGGGGPRLSCSTVNGDILIRER